LGWIGEGRGAQICGYGLVVEPQPSKLMARVRVPLPAPEKIEVNGTLLTREIGKKSAHIAQSVEHFLGKEEVIGSNPIVSTRLDAMTQYCDDLFFSGGGTFGGFILKL
tara:strand:- start:51 stop:374 length:324 start_codon:yes stop_codon:yes gene_type:complete